MTEKQDGPLVDKFSGPTKKSQHSPIVPPDTKSVTDLAPRFHALFAGCERAHGTYGAISLDKGRNDGKVKGQAATRREPLTDALWAQHLAGTYGVGVIPIRDDSTCTWGAIDVDVYADLDHGRVASTLVRMALPLVPCRSKSGGLHLYLFCQVPVSAAEIQKKLQDIAARLGYGKEEIFPKQTTIRVEAQDLGSWVNAPYFDAANTNRYAVRPNGDAMTAEEFLNAADAAKQPAEWFSQSLPQNTDSPLPDGPPCLQHLMAIGFPPGTWNVGVFNLGIYCKKAHPDNWKGHLDQLNAKNFPPDKWPASDLDPIKKSLKKDYFYQCDKQPLKQYCDRETCRQRQYGVGANLLPSLSSLTMLLTSPPVWFLDIEGGHRIELTTEELFNPLAFQIKCGNHRVVVPVTGRAAWTEYLRPFITKANEIPVADDGSGDDSSPRALFLELLENFCTDRVQAQSLEEVRQHKPYTANSVTIFRLSSLMAFMSRKGFKNFQRRDAVVTLKSPGVGGKNWEQSISGKSTRLWSVPEFTKGNTPVPSDPEGF
jgi:hypothetical protein